MKQSRIFICLISLASFTTALGQSDHTLQLYDNAGASGSWVAINSYVDDLTSQAFDDLTSSLCVVRGIWLVYANTFYNTYNPGPGAFFWGENVCHDIYPSLDNQFSSVRYAGSPCGYQKDAVNIYKEGWFQANEMFTDEDSFDLPAHYAGSLIVTGRSAWTLYDSPNYSGYSVCVTPADSSYAYPGFYPSSNDFGFNGLVVRSVRKGCRTADGQDGAVVYKAKEFPSGKIHLKPEEQL